MGRGRAKAKQTKVARDLKYNTPDTDFSALQAELGGASILPKGDDDEFDTSNYQSDQYSNYYDQQSDELKQ